MKKERMSGIGNFTAKELRDLETDHFFLLMGGDTVLIDGIFSLTRKEAETRYQELFNELLDMVDEGLTETDRKHALELIGSLVIVPARIH